MDYENTFTSTGIKLIHHNSNVEGIKNLRMARPISLQIAPTSRCNLACSFCSNANRERHEELPFHSVVTLLRDMSSFGLRTVEWTGGGEPLLYTHFKTGVLSANSIGLKQGLITNGVLLHKVPPDILSIFKWVRISMNCLDYMESINVPKEYIDGTLGFSYVMNDKTDSASLGRLFEHTKMYKPSYVRIVPNCQATHKQQEENNRKYLKMVLDWGPPYFYQAKHFSTPEKCYWGYLKPFVLHNGWVYPCSSVVLNEDSDKTFHSKYQWVRIEDISRLYQKKMVGGNWGCTHCVFRPQNDLIEEILNPSGMEDFV